ncbi:MAG: hypothetical protein QOD06_808 [Candidatus Binatota bacterium]|jgi:phosphoglycerate kinase|nr:hypothetical protein [Candidatus Binatota bacterium]
MPLRTIEELPMRGRRVFVRADLNVPLEDGAIADTLRIDEALPSIKWVIANGGRPVIASHLGRPKGGRDPKLSLRPIAEYLGEVLHVEASFAEDCVGDAVREQSRALGPKQVLVLENLRFHPEEERNDDAFSRELASLCDVYVNDAFGAAHRAHASVVGMVPYVADHGMGNLMKKEIDHLTPLLGSPERPYIVILGGAKVSDKLGVIRSLLQRVDALLLGGAMAYTFLAAQGVNVGDSRTEPDRFDTAREILDEAKKRGVNVVLPVDHVAAPEISPEAMTQVLGPDIPAGFKGVDIGPATIRRFGNEIAHAKTIFWNGPLGIFEIEPFSHGTFAIVEEVARSGAFSVIGGGDSAAAVMRSGMQDDITHVSTGGGASLEFLEGIELPALRALAS